MRFAAGPNARKKATERQKRWRMRRRIGAEPKSSRGHGNSPKSVDALPQSGGDFPAVLLSRRPTGADKNVDTDCLSCEITFPSYAQAEVHVLTEHGRGHECSEAVCGKARMDQIARYFSDPMYARRFRS